MWCSPGLCGWVSGTRPGTQRGRLPSARPSRRQPPTRTGHTAAGYIAAGGHTSGGDTVQTRSASSQTARPVAGRERRHSGRGCLPVPALNLTVGQAAPSHQPRPSDGAEPRSTADGRHATQVSEPEPHWAGVDSLPVDRCLKSRFDLVELRDVEELIPINPPKAHKFT